MRRLLALLLTATPALAQGPDSDGHDTYTRAAAALATYTVVNAAAIPTPLTQTPGDPARGAAVWATHCEGCHAADAVEPDDPARGRETGVLRLAVVNLAIARPDMEGHAFHDAGADPDGAVEPILSPQSVEDVVTWLAVSARQRDRYPLDLPITTP